MTVYGMPAFSLTSLCGYLESLRLVEILMGFNRQSRMYSQHSNRSIMADMPKTTINPSRKSFLRMTELKCEATHENNLLQDFIC